MPVAFSMPMPARRPSPGFAGFGPYSMSIRPSSQSFTSKVTRRFVPNTFIAEYSTTNARLGADPTVS